MKIIQKNFKKEENNNKLKTFGNKNNIENKFRFNGFGKNNGKEINSIGLNNNNNKQNLNIELRFNFVGNVVITIMKQHQNIEVNLEKIGNSEKLN